MPFDNLFDSSFDQPGIFDDDLFDDTIFSLDEVTVDVIPDVPVNDYNYIDVHGWSSYPAYKSEDEEMVLLAIMELA